MTIAEERQWDDASDAIADHLTELEEIYRQVALERDEAQSVARRLFAECLRGKAGEALCAAHPWLADEVDR